MPQAPRRRRLGAIALCSLLALGGAVGPEAASAQKKRKKPTTITSKQIKNGTIQARDISRSVRARINAGARALQRVANGSIGTAQIADSAVAQGKLADAAVTTGKLAEQAVTTGKLADGAVTNPKLGNDAVSSAKVAPDSLTGDDLAPNSVGASELANNSVDSAAVANGSLTIPDLAGVRGVTALDFPSIPANTCSTLTIETNNALSNDLILVTAGPTMPGAITVTGRQQSAGGTVMAVLACNQANVPLDPANTNISWAVLEN